MKNIASLALLVTLGLSGLTQSIPAANRTLPDNLKIGAGMVYSKLNGFDFTEYGQEPFNASGLFVSLAVNNDTKVGGKTYAGLELKYVAVPMIVLEYRQWPKPGEGEAYIFSRVKSYNLIPSFYICRKEETKNVLPIVGSTTDKDGKIGVIQWIGTEYKDGKQTFHYQCRDVQDIQSVTSKRSRGVRISYYGVEIAQGYYRFNEFHDAFSIKGEGIGIGIFSSKEQSAYELSYAHVNFDKDRSGDMLIFSCSI